MKPILCIFLFFFLVGKISAQENRVYLNYENIGYAQISPSGEIAPDRDFGLSGGFSKSFSSWFALNSQLRYYWINDKASNLKYSTNNFILDLTSFRQTNWTSMLVGSSFHWNGRFTNFSIKLEPYAGLMLFSLKNEDQLAYYFGIDGFIGSTDYYSYKSTIVPVWALDIPLGYQINDAIQVYVGISFLGSMETPTQKIKSIAENPIESYPVAIRPFVESRRRESHELLHVNTGGFQFGVRYTLNPSIPDYDIFEWEEGEKKVD